MTSKLSALLVEPSAANREHFKTALRANGEFGELCCVMDCAEAARKLEALGHVDVIFVQVRGNEALVTDFLEQTSRSPVAQDAAFIAILPAQVSERELEQEHLARFDGAIITPFSADSQAQCVALARSIRRTRRQARLQRVLQLLVVEIRAQLAQVTQFRSLGRPARIGASVLREMCAGLRELGPDGQALYFDLLIERFSKPTASAPATPIRGRGYRGASERVRASMSRRAVRRLQTALVNAGPDEEPRAQNGRW